MEDKVKHYEVRRIKDEYYPIGIIKLSTGEIIGRYYESSRRSAEGHCELLNKSARKKEENKE